MEELVGRYFKNYQYHECNYFKILGIDHSLKDNPHYIVEIVELKPYTINYESSIINVKSLYDESLNLVEELKCMKLQRRNTMKLRIL